MSKKDAKEEVNTSTEEVKVSKKEADTSKEKKKKIILVVVGVILLAIILFLLWFFNRKFDVTFDLNNGTKNEVVQVKYNKVLKEKDIKTKKDLGEQFIDWYEVIDVKDNEDVLDEEPFDFDTKIKKNTKLKAVYEGVVETITITFDSRGGSKVDSITINKGTELSLPTNPTYKGYKFITWETENETPVYDKALLSESMTLYAKWEKVEEKKETPKQETPKQEEKKEETISLSLSRNVIHRNGVSTATATASVENASGAVTYSINDGNCVRIDSSTGVITASNPQTKTREWDIKCANKENQFVVTATLPSGKSATATITLEKDLYANFTGSENNNTLVGLSTAKDFYHAGEQEFSITANQNVSWSAKCKNEVTYYGATCKYIGTISTTATIFKGTLVANYTNSDGRTSKGNADSKVTFSTPAGQSLTLTINQRIN
ncbi:MAG: InlB B-repeat-containing protein [Bacilli bacterium]